MSGDTSSLRMSLPPKNVAEKEIREKAEPYYQHSEGTSKSNICFVKGAYS